MSAAPPTQLRPGKASTPAASPATSATRQRSKQLAPPPSGAPQRAPDDVYPTPADERFEERDYMSAPDLSEIAKALVKADRAQFDHFKGLHVVYLWRRKGGSTGGRLTLGKCQKPTGLLAYFAGADFVVWLAADHHRDRVAGERAGASRFEVEAALFHEMLHVGIETDDDGNVRNVIVPHDFTAFNAEVTRYGAWKGDLRAADQSFRQMPLWSGEGGAAAPDAPLGARRAVGKFAADMQAMVDDEGSGITGVSVSAGGRTATIARRKADEGTPADG